MDNREMSSTRIEKSANTQSGDSDREKTCSILDDERNYVGDLPLEELLPLLQVSVGTREGLPLDGGSASNPGLSVVADYQNYVDDDMSMKELSRIIEMAEADNLLSHEDISIDPNSSDEVGCLTFPDDHRPTSSEIHTGKGKDVTYLQQSEMPENTRGNRKLCFYCSQINLAYGSSHFNLAHLKMSAASGCPSCELMVGAMDGIEQHTCPDTRTEKEFKTKKSCPWARGSDISVEKSRNLILFKLFDSTYTNGRPHANGDIVKAFEFCKSQSDQSPSSSSVSGRIISPTPTFELVFKWLQRCEDGHIKCKQKPDTTLPTRVIDVSKETPVLVHSNGKSGAYMLLSHCWGGQQPITTTQETIAKRALGIDFDTLPKTFQDAITITRKLEIQYLWIDSLCIIQDMKEDWISESYKMRDYYRNGYLTVSALYSPNSHHGILNERPCLPPVRFPKIDNLYLRPQLPNYHEVFRNAPLNNRAWALQERLLSTRILHYSDKEMFWECQTCSARESNVLTSRAKTDPLTLIISEGEDFKRVLVHMADDPSSTTEGAFVMWYRLVTNFSGRGIRSQSDKLPAISGLASLIQSATCATYVGGIWKEEIQSLLWTRTGRTGRFFPNEVKPPVFSCEGPSWSWVSVEGQIRYHYGESILSGNDAVILSFGLPNFAGEEARGRYGHIVLRARSQKLNYNLYSSENNYQVDSVLSRRGTCKYETSIEWWMDFHVNEDHDRYFDDQTIIRVREDAWTKDSRPYYTSHACTALWIAERKDYAPITTVDGKRTFGYTKSLMCLLVEEVDDSRALATDRTIMRPRWRRIGVGIIKTDPENYDQWSELDDFTIV